MKVEKYKLGKEKNSKAYLTSYYVEDYRVDTIPKSKKAIIICPGGGWFSLSEREGEPIALAFLQKGFQAFVLHYSVADGNDECGSLVRNALAELEESYDYLIANKVKFNIDIKKINILGFSAGGQLAALFANKHSELMSVILCYPMLDMEDVLEYKSTEDCPEYAKLVLDKSMNILDDQSNLEINPIKIINSSIPPTFIWHGREDDLIPAKGSINYVTELIAKGIKCEFHLYDNVNHGISLGISATAAVESEINIYGSRWFDEVNHWLEKV